MRSGIPALKSRERSFFALTRLLLPPRPELLGENFSGEGHVIIFAGHPEQNSTETFVMLVLVLAFWAGLMAQLLGSAVWLALTVPIAPLLIHGVQIAVGLGCGALQKAGLLETKQRRPLHSVIHATLVAGISLGWIFDGGTGWFAWIAWMWISLGGLNLLAALWFVFRSLFEELDDPGKDGEEPVL
jgi:hypothetical protein